MKLHLPDALRHTLLAAIAITSLYPMAKADLALGNSDTVSIKYSDVTSIPCVDGTLQLKGDTKLQLTDCGSGDGQNYVLFTGVTRLVDENDNTISDLTLSEYFDTNQLGTGFWANGKLKLENGTVQLVLHDETVIRSSNEDGITIYNTRQYNPAPFEYYKGLVFEGVLLDNGDGSGNIGASGIDSNDSAVLNNNGSVKFIDNQVNNGYGGAIIVQNEITINNNGSVEFSGNGAVEGGAVYGESSTVTLNNNGSVKFSGNEASYGGGAIRGHGYGVISLSNNSSVEFSHNTAGDSNNYANGGAIFGNTVMLNDNGKVEFIANSVHESYFTEISAGAIHVYGNLYIQNNDSVIFEKNVNQRADFYSLRSIYVDYDYANVGNRVASFSAAEGKSIEFRDAVYIGKGITMNLNENYIDAEGNIHKQQGDIIFSGKNVVDDLYEAKGNIAGTEEEIIASRTSEVYAETNLYGGRLRVEDGAIYHGYGITVHEGSNATVLVKDATLSHNNYDLVFNENTTLELVGNNTIVGNVQMQAKSTVLLNVQETQGTTEILGDLNLEGYVTLALNDDSASSYLNQRLVYVAGSVTGWNAENVTVTGIGTHGASNLCLVENLLVLNYDASTFNKYFNGSAKQDKQLEGKFALNHHYEALEYENLSGSWGGAVCVENRAELSSNGSVVFRGNESYQYGGAVYGHYDSIISLNYNAIVEFSKNLASWDGGAISSNLGGAIFLCNNGSVKFNENLSYGDGGAISLSFNINSSTGYSGTGLGWIITIKNNESVEFNGNIAQNGGAIYSWEESSIIINGNGSVKFIGNQASSLSEITGLTSTGYGGAIYAWSDLSIQNNDSVLFKKNAEVDSEGSYRLRCLYAEYDYNEDRKISFSAAESKSIEFQDAVYIGTGITVNMNEDYIDAEGKSHKQLGDILFTGKYVADNLYEIKGNVAGTETEIQNSSTSEVNSCINLYGGRLRVEDGAIFQGAGIIAHEGSESTVLVKDAELYHEGYELHFFEETKLETLGESLVYADVIIGANATADLSSLTQLNGSLTLETGSTLIIDGTLMLNGELMLGDSLTLGGNMLEMVNLLQIEESLTLISGIDYFAIQKEGNEYASVTNGQQLSASTYFSNLKPDQNLILMYDQPQRTLSVIRVTAPIPEPTTATLSLLALAAMAARRRRK